MADCPRCWTAPPHALAAQLCEACLQAVSVGMAAGGVVYRHTLEDFLRQLPPDLLSRRDLDALGLAHPRDVNHPTWVALVHVAARRTCPGATRDEALERIGREMLRGYARGLVGRGAFIVARLLGPQRALQRMAASYETADSLMRVQTSVTGAREVTLDFNSTGGMATYTRGVLSEVLNQLGVPRHDVTFSVDPAGPASYVVRWE